MAREDLLAIVQYIGRDSQTIAGAFGNALRDKTTPLAERPALGQPGRLPDIRELVVHQSHIVFYRALDEERTLQVRRVKPVALQVP
ncbi:type II toxin-antitoxin system RelE/ParE family toxin [Accumulibacter sp.]|uniref:type II toxin-antitoxin system RelE/ParE family toxin n=1 Tax=Accumulibacter sp. TaxID=2053492 RepID=UPI00262D49A9|nr:type II toxin-antitoxin system RelE/ParE family toxin [Accumulibacter sp.]